MLIRVIALIVINALLCSADVSAQLKEHSSILSEKTGVSSAKRALQGFSMRVWISNQMVMGLQAFDEQPGESSSIGLEYPLRSNVEHLYAAGPVIAGIVNGSRRVSEGYNLYSGQKNFLPDPDHPLRGRIWISNAYLPSEDFNSTPGRTLMVSVNRRGCDDDRDGMIDEDELDGLDNDGDWVMLTDDVGSDGIPDSMEVGCKGLYAAVANPDPAYDNYHDDTTSTDLCHLDNGGFAPRMNDADKYTERNGIPDHGESGVDEDYAAISENDLYCSATDTVSQPGVYPMGIKVIQKSYAWSGGFAEAILPFDYTFINIGENTIRDAYLGIVAECDIGRVDGGPFWTRNYSCFLESLLTAYTHNPVDREATPLGVTLLKAPKPFGQLDVMFQWFDFSTRTVPCGLTDSCFYEMMSGSAFPQRIAPCQSQTAPSDSRFLLSFGKFDEFKPGDTLMFSIALVSGEGVEHGSKSMSENVRKAIQLFNRGYNEPAIPPSPNLAIEKGDRRVKLRWGGGPSWQNPLETWDDSNKLAESVPDTHWRRPNPPCGDVGSTECQFNHFCTTDSSGQPYLPGGRIFEGYRVYRSESFYGHPPSSSFTLLREFDLQDDEYGYNFGLDSVSVDSNIARGKRYWYSITSFSVPNISIIERQSPSGGGVIYDTLLSAPTESGIYENFEQVEIPFSTSTEPNQVLVVPNPYRGDVYYTDGNGFEGREYDWTPDKRAIWFIRLPERATIRIVSLVGDVIATIHHDDAIRASMGKPTGQEEWNLFSESTRPIASGVYVFSVESQYGKQIGKFAIIM